MKPIRVCLNLTLILLLLVFLNPSISANTKDDCLMIWGGTGSDYTHDVTTDKNGNMYITGGYQRTVDFDPGTREELRKAWGNTDAFLTKLDSKGELQWIRAWGGKGQDHGGKAVVDKDGNVFVAGYFSGSSDFDAVAGRNVHSSNGGYDVFLLKYNRDAVLLWVKTFGGWGNDTCSDITMDKEGNIFLVGNFYYEADFNPDDAEEKRTGVGEKDFYLSKFDPDGNFEFVRIFGGFMDDAVYAVNCDKSGNLYLCGTTDSYKMDYDPGLQTFEQITLGGEDAFLTKLDHKGKFIWTKTWGSPGNDAATDLDLDQSGNIYVTGYFQEEVDFDTSDKMAVKESNGNKDAYVCKIKPDGSLEWVESWGGKKMDQGIGIACGKSNSVIVTGIISETVDFDPTPKTNEIASKGETDLFICKFTKNGKYQWSRVIGGEGKETPCYPHVDNGGDIFITGWFMSPEIAFYPGESESIIRCSGGSDAFLLKLNPNGN